MKRLLATLCLFGAMGANAQPSNICPEEFPASCQDLCMFLRHATGIDYQMQTDMLLWLFGYYDSSGRSSGCEADLRAFHNDSAACACFLSGLYRQLERPPCSRLPQACMRSVARAMMTDPQREWICYP